MSSDKENAIETEYEEAPVSVGRLLHDQRKADGIQIEAAAQELFIDKRHLEAIEKDDFEAIKGEVFIRGYTRSYAQYLNMDVDLILTMLEPHIERVEKKPSKREIQFLDAKKRQDAQLDYSRASFTFKDRRTPLWIYLIIIVILLFLAGIFIFQFFQPPAEQTVQQIDIELEPFPQEKKQQPSLAPLPQVSDKPANIEVQKKEEQEEEQEKDLVIPQPTAEQKRLQFTVNGNSWLEVIDSSNNKAVSNLFAGGETIDIIVNVPANVVIGNINSVELTVNGTLFDAGKHARGNVARFTIP